MVLLSDFSLLRKPEDWTLSWGGSGQILGWGHNHRGQLGGVEGAKVKLPISCESLANLRPVQLIGGEQTLFSITAEGKVCVLLSRPYVSLTDQEEVSTHLHLAKANLINSTGLFPL